MVGQLLTHHRVCVPSMCAVRMPKNKQGNICPSQMYWIYPNLLTILFRFAKVALRTHVLDLSSFFSPIQTCMCANETQSLFTHTLCSAHTILRPAISKKENKINTIPYVVRVFWCDHMRCSIFCCYSCWFQSCAASIVGVHFIVILYVCPYSVRILRIIFLVSNSRSKWKSNINKQRSVFNAVERPYEM